MDVEERVVERKLVVCQIAIIAQMFVLDPRIMMDVAERAVGQKIVQQ
jgi:hypothetical protein